MKSWLKKIAVLVVLLLAGWFAWSWYHRSSPQKVVKSSAASYVAVRRGPMVINLIESGTIQPLKQHVIKNLVEGRATITYIVPEGEQVKKGQLLVKFDSSDFEDRLANQEILTKNAEASLTQARENLEVVKNQAKADVSKAELDLRFAREDLVKYQKGEYPKTLNEAETKVTLANEELKRAKDKLEWSTKLYAEKYLSESDYRTDALSCKRYELELKSSENALNLLKEYTYKRQIAQLTSDVEQAVMALDRGRRKANADVTQAVATLNAKELELHRQADRAEKLRSQVAKCTVLSPADGLVIYATSNQSFFRPTQEPLAVGTEVWARQELIYLPEGEQFKADVKVHESNLKKLYRGLPVRITVDAIKDRTFQGKVQKIAPLPDAQSLFMNPDLKLYATDVVIDGGKGVLKNGMNCKAEVIVEQLEDALYVPLQCVVREQQQTVVYVKTEAGEQRRPVDIGLDNNQFVHIKSGLREGEQVSMVPPLNHADLDDESTKVDPGLTIPRRPQKGGGPGSGNIRPTGKFSGKGGGRPGGVPSGKRPSLPAGGNHVR